MKTVILELDTNTGDIKEKAKTMTRSEFMNWYEEFAMLKCPGSFNITGNDKERCYKNNGNCIDCMEEAIKNIKFKNENLNSFLKDEVEII